MIDAAGNDAATVRRILVIGIGAGSPAHLTLQAIEAINRADLFFVFDKGEAASELVAAREAILAAHRRAPWRVVPVESPRRRAEARVHPAAEGGEEGGAAPADPALPGPAGAYRAGVADWHGARAGRLAQAIAAQLPPGGTGAVLVWGDPAIYDSMLRILEQTRAHLALVLEVIPGISAIQALCAAHGQVLNAVGEKVTITTGRRVLADYPTGGGSLVVMLDDGSGLAALIAREARARAAGASPLLIWWGAYLGMREEMLASGPLHQVGHDILARRAQARARRGWIMDVWLVRG
ncbi:precorrin-6A synthase [Angulomicrobium tetraedrale]|uniref:Precorrin-6A synthase n=1 Tax=Ancylobacter tetraedralis TaxID=217068 RepID=A0A839Z1M4_9HYPH|nr:precorrin 6A synthase [Ancylobacter tetraedralis]MBB3770624.1 precorrin-6A synthase [Ancylobacter tetraedralis]